MSTNSIASVVAVNTKVAVKTGFFLYGDVQESHALVTNLAARLHKAGCEINTLRFLDSGLVNRGFTSVCVLTSDVRQGLMDMLKILHRQVTVRLYTTFDMRKLQGLYYGLGAGEWVRKDTHFLWVPVNPGTWMLPYKGTTRLSEGRARILGFLDNHLQPVRLEGDAKAVAGTSTRVVAKEGWSVTVNLKGLHVQELPPEYIQYMLSEKADKLDSVTLEMFTWATNQPWYREAIENLLEAKDARDGDRAGGFAADDVKPQDATGFRDPNVERAVAWENFGVSKTPVWLPVSASEKQDGFDEWRVVRNSYEKVGGTTQVRLLPEDEGKVDDDQAGLWMWSWRYMTKVLGRMERAQTLGDLQDLLELFMTAQSKEVIAYDEEGRLHVERERECKCVARTGRPWNQCHACGGSGTKACYVMWVRVPQTDCVDPDTKEAYSEPQEGIVDMILKTYNQQRERIVRREESRDERLSGGYVTVVDDGDCEHTRKIRGTSGVVRRFQQNQHTEVVDVVGNLRRRVDRLNRDLERAKRAAWNKPVSKIDGSEVDGAVDEAIRFADSQK